MWDEVDYITWPQSTITVIDHRDGPRIGFRREPPEKPEHSELRERMEDLWQRTGES